MPAKSGLNSRLQRNSYGLQLTQVYSGTSNNWFLQIMPLRELSKKNPSSSKDSAGRTHLRTQQRHIGALDHKLQCVRKRRDERKGAAPTSGVDKSVLAF